MNNLADYLPDYLADDLPGNIMFTETPWVRIEHSEFFLLQYDKIKITALGLIKILLLA